MNNEENELKGLRNKLSNTYTPNTVSIVSNITNMMMMTKQILQITAPLENLMQPQKHHTTNQTIYPCPVMNNGSNIRGWAIIHQMKQLMQQITPT